jgi:hypothetical protein
LVSAPVGDPRDFSYVIYADSAGEPLLTSMVENPMRGNVHDVFLLGAGFARAISPSMPLLQDLAERIIGTLGKSEPIPDEVQAMMKENFAHALSYLEQAKPWVTEADNLRHRALFLDISNAIARDLDETVSRAGHTLGSHPPDWLRQLILHWHEQRCIVLTLNYDTLIESVAATVELPDDAHILASDLYPPVLTDAGLRSGGVTPERRTKSFRLLKLHGSTNWYYSGRAEAHGEPIYFVPPLSHVEEGEDERQQHAERLRAVADKYPFLVPPIYDKSPLLTHETIRALWFAAGDALRQAQRIFSMGYSLPESDLTMMHFLRTTCGQSACIELINQSADAIEHFKRLFRGTSVRVDQRATGENCVAEFVERQLGAG